jgi:hypothetical protein
MRTTLPLRRIPQLAAAPVSLLCKPRIETRVGFHSTVTLLARFLGLSTSVPFTRAT